MGLLLLLTLISFTKIIRGCINLLVAFKKNGKTSKEADSAYGKIFVNAINVMLCSGCAAFVGNSQISFHTLLNILYMYLTLNLILFAHELGHYLAAKKLGIKVDSFTVGMGMKIFEREKNGTTFTFRIVPFLGFVKPKNPKDLDTLKSRQRILFASGGLIINFVLYVLGFIIVSLGKGYSLFYGIKKSFVFLFDMIIYLIHSISLDLIYTPEGSFDGQVEAMLTMSEIFSDFWMSFTVINLMLLFLNLFPIPPLDGSHIVKEVLIKSLQLLKIPKKAIRFVSGAFIAMGLLFFGSRSLINNGWDMYNELNGRWIELSLWLLFFCSVIGYFTQRKLDKKA